MTLEYADSHGHLTMVFEGGEMKGAPRAPNALIISAPIPRELPVTSATLPVKSKGSFITFAASVESSG